MAVTITVNISDLDQTILLNDLTSIDSWIQAAVIGKISNAKKRLIAQGRQVLIDDPAVTQMPTDDDDLINNVTTRPDYKDRTARDSGR